MHDTQVIDTHRIQNARNPNKLYLFTKKKLQRIKSYNVSVEISSHERKIDDLTIKNSPTPDLLRKSYRTSELPPTTCDVGLQISPSYRHTALASSNTAVRKFP